MDKNLRSYVQQARAANVSDQNIERALIAAGWSTSAVKEAMETSSGTPGVIFKTAREHHPRAIVMVVLVGIVLALVGVVAAFIVSQGGFNVIKGVPSPLRQDGDAVVAPRAPTMPTLPSPVPPSAQPRSLAQPTGQQSDEPVSVGISFQENNRTFREFGRQYDDVTIELFRTEYAEVGGTLAYLAFQGNETFIVHRGREIGRELTGHGGIVGPFDVGGKPAFGVLSGDDSITAQPGVGSYIFVDGQKFGQQYAAIKDATSINGKLVFIGVYADPSRPSGERSVVYYEGREYGQKFTEVSEPFSFNGKLAFYAQGWLAGSYDSEVIVVADGVETILPESQYEAGEVRDENGKLIYLSRAGSRARDEAIVDGKRVYVGVQSSPENIFGRGYVYVDDQRRGEEYEYVFEVELVNGKLALLVQKNGKGVIIYDGQEYGHHYDYLYNLPGYSTEPYSLAYPGTFTAINYLGDVGGKLTYVVTIEKTENFKTFKHIIVMEE